jgi:ABC-type Fe3+-siderophore transport system permease subunit
VGDAGVVSYRRTRRTRGVVSWPRTLTGLLAGGLVALALALLVAWFVAARIGSAGPGPDMLVGHGVAAVLAVVAQVQADRRTGPPAALAMAAVVAITVAVLAVQWLA